MKSLLTVTAVLEFGTGLLLVAIPATLSALLLGAPLETPAALTVARVGGVALVALATACWMARLESGSRAARGLVGALALYNSGTLVIFLYAGLALGLSGLGLWPVVGAHAALTAWCLSVLLGRRH